MRSAALLFFALAIAAPCATFAGSETIHRCIGEHGEISFSDAPCTGASAPIASPSASTSNPSTIAGVRDTPKQTCPASEEALRTVIADAFARRDANTLAGVMRWDGVGGAAARERMRELADLTGRPLIGIDIDGARADEPAASDAPSEGTLLTVRTGSLEAGASQHEFRLMPAAGCYWLDW